MKISFKSKSRIIAFILMISLLVTSLPLSAISIDTSEKSIASESVNISEDRSKVTVLHDGAGKPSVVVDEDGTETLTSFVTEIAPTGRGWQILAPDTNKWVNIYGSNSETLTVSYSLVGSMLNSEGKAYIRSLAYVGTDAYVSDSCEIVISYKSEESGSTTESAALYSSAKRASPLADNSDLETFTIVINYIFDNGGIAFEPYGASVAKGSDFSEEIESPDVTGYEPFRRIGEDYVDASIVKLDYTNITENITINVIYEPAIVDFQVHHHLQDLYDDDYSLTADYITYGKGLTGSIVTDGLALTENELPGFKALAYEKLTIAADGSTVVEIRYNRNYYLVDFDMGGGFGVEPVYTRFGAEVGANDPVRHGYVFDGWELALYGGETPSAEMATKYDINSAVIIVPDANLTYKAKWITLLVNYTMVFWKENADDNGFTYWGYLDGLTAMSGSYVDGADRVREADGIDDEAYFTYNDTLTDKNVLVEGDGSTIVNVYYTRNRYSITFKAPGLCVIEEGHSHSDDCYQTVCTKGHVHSEQCSPVLTCTQDAHEAHTDECVICGKTQHTHTGECCAYSEHTHTTSCYSGVGNRATVSNAPTNARNGYIYVVRSGWRSNYYIYIGGLWYSYSGRNVSSGDIVNAICGNTEHIHGSSDCECALEPHTHSESCYKDTLHTHDADNCYSYSCGDDWHIHEEGCRVLHCPIPVGHTHTSNCRNSSRSNTVKIVYKKYQENLESIWPITDSNGVSYNSGERWTPSDSSTYSQVLVYIANMPGESFTLTLSTSQNDTYTMNYYLEVIEGESYDVSYDGKNYKLYTTVKANYNYITKAEDFFNINGFYGVTSDPLFDRNGQIDINGGGTVNFYYGRIVDHHLDFRSNGEVLTTKSVYGIPYGASLKDYNFIPDYPSSLEPNAFVFAGWYTSPGHYDGTEVDWDTIKMDEGDVMLYAKWAPITHTVTVYFDNTLQQQIGEVQLVSHGNFANPPSETLENGNYIFQGWFYQEVEDGIIVEKAFVFTGIPILHDMDIYAKWSSHVSVNYRINYVLKNTGEVISDPTEGSSLSGHNKTFYAKAGDELYTGYRTGYYPLTSSHTVTMSAEADHEFTFEYVFVPSMPYLVRYVDSSGNAVWEEKRVLDNNLSVVTETFVRVDKMMPDAYQKRLVLSASDIDEDNDGIFDTNVITFNYSSDEEHAYYRVVYYIENLTGDGYREYRSEDSVGDIGKTYTISPKVMSGFSFNGAKTMVNGSSAPTSSGEVSATLTSDGLLIEIYYDRVDVNYYVKYLEAGTEKELYTTKVGSGIFGEQVVEYAPTLTHIGYTLDGDSVKSKHLSATEETNVIEFYYKESVYSLKYQIVGFSDGGTLSLTSENISAVTGSPRGSEPILDKGYHFVGWYLDEACNHPVPAEWVGQTTNKLIPESDNGIWLANHVYYAKIEPDFTTLTITTVGCSDVDEGQIFIYQIVGTSSLSENISVTVAAVGNGTVTVTDLPFGTYSVTSLSEWSYRYTPDSVTKSISLSVNAENNSVTFSQLRTETKWLDGNANALNNFD